MFKQLSRAVVVNADQTPQYADIRRAGHEGGEFLFVPKGLTQAAAAAPQTDAPTGQSRSGAANSGLELTFWQSIQASERAADFEAYLEQFPNGAFALFARNRVPHCRSKRHCRRISPALGLAVS